MKIINFGSCNVDYVYSLDHIVKVGETEATEKLSVFPGGKGLNQSIAIAKAGAKVYHAGCIGKEGEFLERLLLENGVDLSYIKHTDEKNGHAIIQVTKDGDNSIFLYPGSNATIYKEDIDRVISCFSAGDIILLQNEISNIDYIIEKAYAADMQIILNPSPCSGVIFDIDLGKLSYIILNEVEAKIITGFDEYEKSLEYFSREYPSLKVMLTLGSRGSVYMDKDCMICQPSFTVDAVDTTAAGDTFTGYFVAGVAGGMPYKDILKIASCASAIAVSRKGAAPSIPKRDEVLEMMTKLKPRDGGSKGERAKEKIEKYIDEHIENASLSELAEILNYSRFYTADTVKKVTGKTFKELLQDKRLDAAARLLCETDLTVSEVIRKVGYQNESFFRKKFIEKYNTTPFKYRGILKNDK